MSEPRPQRHRRPRSRPGLAGPAAAAAAAVATVLAATGGPAAAAPSPAPSATAARAAEDGVRVVSRTWLDGRTVDLRIASPAVGRTVPVRVLLPPGWAADASRTWPVLYLLQGAHDDYTSWTRETDIEGFTRDRDLITVMPSSGPTGIPTRWWGFGLPGAPDYETFQADELMRILRRDFRAGPTRAVAGVSTGGYGAMAFAARRPGTFAAAASYSGLLHTTMPGSVATIDVIVAREGLLPWSLWGDPFLQAARWRDHDPYTRAGALRGTALYISSGSGVPGGPGDPVGGVLEAAVWPGATSFAARLHALDIPVTAHLYPGGSHNWAYWDREFRASWPLLAHALGVAD